MVLLTNGDVTESFFHLSSDQSDHISSEEDVSIQTQDNLSEFLRLAKVHDMKAVRSDSMRDSGDEHYMGEWSNHSFRRNNKTGQTQFDRFKRHVSQPSLKSGSYPRHFIERYEQARRLEPTYSKEHDKADESDENGAKSTLEEDAMSSKKKNKKTVKDFDLESLFHAFEPLLDKYFKTRNEEIAKRNIQDHALPDSDPDSAADDTFDHPKLHGLRLAKLEHSSPVTSPPQSSGDSQFIFDKSTQVDESDTCRQICSQPKKGLSPKTSKRRARRPPQVEVGDLTSDEIDLDWRSSTNDKTVTVNHDEHQIETLESLRIKVDQYKKDNDGMQNEIAYLRCKLDALVNQKPDEIEIMNGNKNNKNAKLYQKESQDMTHNEFEANLPDQFRPYYQSLQLYKFDELSQQELRIVIKNLMLSLLVSDFDHLSEMAPRVGAFLRITLLFLDTLHERLYPYQDMKPSLYLRNYKIDINTGFQECLDGMMKLVIESTEERF